MASRYRFFASVTGFPRAKRTEEPDPDRTGTGSRSDQVETVPPRSALFRPPKPIFFRTEPEFPGPSITCGRRTVGEYEARRDESSHHLVSRGVTGVLSDRRRQVRKGFFRLRLSDQGSKAGRKIPKSATESRDTTRQ